MLLFQKHMLEENRFPRGFFLFTTNQRLTDLTKVRTTRKTERVGSQRMSKKKARESTPLDCETNMRSMMFNVTVTEFEGSI